MSSSLKKLIEKLDTTPTTVGTMIRVFRKGRGLTLKQVESLTGISETNLSVIENDKIDLGVKRAILISAALGVMPGDILFPKGVWKKTDEYLAVEKKAQELIEAS